MNKIADRNFISTMSLEEDVEALVRDISFCCGRNVCISCYEIHDANTGECINANVLSLSPRIPGTVQPSERKV